MLGRLARTDRSEGVVAEGCLACDLAAGRASLPGGLIHEVVGWRVEHCVGPLGVGTLIVKPVRHVTAVRDLEPDEAAALGPLLRETADVADRLVDAEQVYVCLWSHAGGEPGHIHWVVQPVTSEQLTRYSVHGPALQMAMFEEAVAPDPAELEPVADRARALFAGSHY